MDHLRRLFRSRGRPSSQRGETSPLDQSGSGLGPEKRRAGPRGQSPARRGAGPPIEPLGWSDALEAPRRRILPPTRHDVAIAGTLLAAGIAWGIALGFAQSLPVDFGFLLFVLQVGVGLVFLISLLVQLLFRGFKVDRVAIVAVLVIGGATLGLNVGPTVPPAVTVAGTYTFTPTLPAAPASQGALGCEWANGRWRIGVLTTTPISGLPTPHVLTVNLLNRQVQLADGASSTLLAVGDTAVAPPPDQTSRGPGDRTGAISIDVLQVNLAADATDVNEVRGTFSWSCPGPPPG